MKKITLLFLLFAQFSFSQIDSLITQLQTVPKDSTKVKLLNEIGRKSFNVDIKQAFTYLPQAIELSKELNYTNGLIDSYKNLGTAYFYLRKYDSTKVYWRKSLESVPETNFKKKGDAYNNMGVLYQRLSKVDSSLSNYKASVTYRLKLEDSSYVARSYNNIGALYRQKGNYEEALQYYFKALPIYKAYKLKKETSDALNGIGLLYKDLEDYDDAILYLTEAYEIRQTIQNPRLIASSINNLATVYYETDKLDKARTYYEKYLDFAEKMNDKRALAGVYSNLGNMSMQEEKVAEAIAYYTNANKLFKSIGDTENVALTFINLGTLVYNQGNYAVAHDYYKGGLENAEKSGSLSYQKDAYLGLSDTNHQLNNYDAAYESFQKYRQLQETLFKKDLSEKVAFYQEQYEAEKKAKEIQILKTETIKKDKDIALSKSYRNWSIVFSVLLIIMLVLVYNRYKIKQKSFQLKETLLTKEKIASELQTKLQKKELELKAVELSSLTMKSLQKNKLLEELNNKITEHKGNETSKAILIKELNDIVKQGLNFDDNWETFQKHFTNVHPNFFKKLNATYPNLTNNDLKACAYIRMNLSTKEVATLTNVTPKSVKMTRYRLKKKLHLSAEDDLKNFLFEI
jgi:tetratricopeptide (TPR) repeat protein